MPHNFYHFMLSILVTSMPLSSCAQQLQSEADIFSSESKHPYSSETRTINSSNSTTLSSMHTEDIYSSTELSSTHFSSNDVPSSSFLANSESSDGSSESFVSSAIETSSYDLSSETISSVAFESSSSETVWGIQMYTFRYFLGDSYKQTLQFIKDSGYDQIELAGYYGHTADTLLAWGKEIGLDYISTHHTTAPLRDSLPELMASALKLQAQFMVLAWLDTPERATIAQYQALAQELNEWGATLKAQNLKMVYHNHEFEFEELEGQLPYDILLNETDSSLVFFQLDVAWAYKSGINPLKYYQRAPHRYPLFHLKDLAAPGANTVLDLGAGTIDYPSILPALLAHPNQFYFIEHDHSLDPHKSIEVNMEYLDSLGL